MVNIERKEPKEPDKVQTIMELRNIHRLRWREIGAKFNMSAQASYLLYKRWNGRNWQKGTNNAT